MYFYLFLFFLVTYFLIIYLFTFLKLFIIIDRNFLCSGMFRVPDFIDGLGRHSLLSGQSPKNVVPRIHFGKRRR